LTTNRSYRTEAIVIRRRDIGEADRLLTLYSPSVGKIRVVARGARKPLSRKTGHVELYMRSTFQLARGKGLDIVSQVELLDSYRPIREELVKSSYASYLVELLDQFTADSDPDPDKYHLLDAALKSLAQDVNPRLLSRHYELRLLTLAGFRPRLFHCAGCGEEIKEEDQYFSADSGGLLCPACHHLDRRARPITSVAVKVLRYLQSRGWETVRDLRIRAVVVDEIEATMAHFLTHTLERNLRSSAFIRRLRREE